MMVYWFPDPRANSPPKPGYPSFPSTQLTWPVAPVVVGKGLWNTDHTFIQSHHKVLPKGMLPSIESVDSETK